MRSIGFFLLVLLFIGGVASAGTQDSDVLYVKPPDLSQPDLSGELGKDIAYLCRRQLGADCRDRLVFGGKSYLKEFFAEATPGKRMGEHQIRPYASIVFAAGIVLAFGDYNAADTGFEYKDLAKITASLSRELSAHHIANTDKSSWWWGDDWQSAHWSAALSTGAWMIWDRLPSDTRKNVANMVAHEADRYLYSPAPFNEFNDTKAEENAWNGKVLVMAYCMLPNHPHRAAWGEKAIEYIVTAYATPQDVTSTRIVDGKPLNQRLRGPNMHSDYTLENHGFFHPDYITSSSQNVHNLAIYRLAGESLPESCLFNIQQCRELVSFLTLPNGWTYYPQATDWSNYRHDVTFMAQMANSVMPDPAAARCLRWGLDFLKYVDSADAGKTSQNLFRGINFNCCPLQTLADLYMMHYLFGPGAEPLTDGQARKQLCGTKLWEQGKCVVSRSENSIASFSWFNADKRLMAVVTPLSPDGFCVPKFRSLIGMVGGKIDPVNIISREVKTLPNGGFSAGLICERGTDKTLKEQIIMVTLPDGRTIYAEWFDSALKPSEELRTGLIFREKNAFWHRNAEPTVFYPGGQWNAASGNLVIEGDKASWLNLGGRMGIVVHSSRNVLIDESQISLNYLPAQSPELPKRMVAVFLPAASVQDTEKAAAKIKIEAAAGRSIIVNLGDIKLTLNPDECAASYLSR